MDQKAGRKTAAVGLVLVAAFFVLVRTMQSTATEKRAENEWERKVAEQQARVDNQAKEVAEEMLRAVERAIASGDRIRVMTTSAHKAREENEKVLRELYGRKDCIDAKGCTYEEDVIGPAREFLEESWVTLNKDARPCKIDEVGNLCYPDIGNQITKLRELKKRLAETKASGPGVKEKRKPGKSS